MGGEDEEREEMSEGGLEERKGKEKKAFRRIASRRRGSDREGKGLDKDCVNR